MFLSCCAKQILTLIYNSQRSCTHQPGLASLLETAWQWWTLKPCLGHPIPEKGRWSQIITPVYSSLSNQLDQVKIVCGVAGLTKVRDRNWWWQHA